MSRRTFQRPSRRLLLSALLGVAGIVVVNAAALLIFLPDAGADIRNAYDHFAKGNGSGFVRRTWFDDNGGRHKYVVFVPDQFKADDTPPLLVFLHGYSVNGDDGIQHIQECLGPAIWEARSSFPFVVLFPQCPAGSTWNANDVAGKLTMELLRKTQREYNIDPDRVYLTGVSSGANGVWSLASNFPDVFAAALPISGIPAGDEMAKAIADSQLPVWNYFVRGDGDNLEAANHRMHEALLKYGASPLFTEIDGTLSETWWKHNAWHAAYRNHATYSWLLSHSRSHNAANSHNLFRTIPGNQGLTGSNRPPDNDWSVDESGILSFDGTAAKDRPASMMYDATFQNYELHFEFRYETGQEFELVFPSHSGNDVATKIALPECGSGGAYNTASATCLQMADPSAQRGLFRQIWNDVRIRIDGNHLVVQVNGWKFLDLQDDIFLDRSDRFSIRVHPKDVDIQWRHFRIREVKR